MITVVGTGWTRGQLTLDAAEALRSGARILLHTERCGCGEWLREQGIAFESLDALYEECDDFDEHIRAAVRAVLDTARAGNVIYGVSDVRDRTVAALLDACGEVRVIAGPPVEESLLAMVTGETLCTDASEWENLHCAARMNCLVREVDSRELAAELKLKLMEAYPEEHEIWLLNACEAPRRVALYELDRAQRYDHRTCALIPAVKDLMALERYDFGHLNEIMRILCAPGGCPWDRAQTHESLRTYLLEEACEAIDAIDSGDPDHICDELGDVLLQVALHAEIARRHGEFDITDVTTAICVKMIQRHSHVFGADHATDAESVLDLWNRNKMRERGQRTVTETMRGVTRALPALLRAVKVQKNSANAGIGVQDAGEALINCCATLAQLQSDGPDEAVLGAALFHLADAARMWKIDPEISLGAAVNRYIDRFEAVERELLAEGRTFSEASADRLRKDYCDSVKL